MTVLMRLAGLIVPDMYGPAKEQWTTFGLEPPQMYANFFIKKLTHEAVLINFSKTRSFFYSQQK